jgi:outer membrane lipoprotein SlyB
MKISIKAITATAMSAVIFVGLGAELYGQRRPALRTNASRSANQLQTVPAGTRMRVRINETISSKTARVGDRFTATVREPVYSANGAVVIPVGSEVAGRVDMVNKAKKGGDPGAIDVTFVQLILPNGTKRTINGSLTELVSDDAKSDPEGTASGDRMKNRKIIFIGGGGAGGAVLGAAIGGGKGALIGGLIGAGAGLLGERFTKGEEADVKSGTEFGIYLNQGISLPRFAEVQDDEVYTESPSVGGRTYIVQRGDTLGVISRKMYGTSSRYMEIYNANRDRLSSPNNVTVGQTLIIP